MAKRASFKPDETTGAEPDAPLESTTPDAAGTITEPLPTAESEPETDAGRSARAPVRPARVLTPGRVQRVTLREARALGC